MNAETDDRRTYETETEAIRQVVATLQHAQRNELVEEFVSLFRHDAIWTTGHGRRLFGRDEIAAFTRRVLPGAMRESAAVYEVEHVLFIRPDVAAVKVRQRPVTLDGEPIEGERGGSPLYVMAKENGRWLLVACQNTPVLDA
ncbi:SgcJ/EcaC family oxidoreductase [Streptomyces macrosporus]|uniref:SgcJ/EcaC family oxidoreductase n=1 Tax=Streptomyces macrosporus TaxID=44032 RepID=A0ABN3JLY3_9ACTN